MSVATMASGALAREIAELPKPVLIASTAVGRGMVSIGEAILELCGSSEARHIAIEEFLPARARNEDLERYKWISSKFPALLNIPYRFAPVYIRKVVRERLLRTTDLSRLSGILDNRGFRSAVCVSHRPAFWVAAAKLRNELDVRVVGLLGEYGTSLGWKYNFWSGIDDFFSPVPRAELRFRIPAHVRFVDIELPARREYRELAGQPGDPSTVLLVCGFWGQGRMDRVVRELLAETAARIIVICGENEEMRARILAIAESDPDRIEVHGAVASLAPFLERCASIITKPGISTLLEAHAAGRKIFLLRGMPVAEDNNLRHALEHFDAEMYSAGAVARFAQ